LLSARSQAWNIAIAVVEAGLEEGLQHLNSNRRTNLLADGWAYVGGAYTRSNTLPDGNTYVVNISITNLTTPSIVSQAYVKAPLFNQRGSSTIFGAIGAVNSTPSTLVSRAVQVNCYKSHLFTGAMAARRQINLNGNNVLTDSFDSVD